MIADKKAIVSVLESAFKIALLCSSEVYHFVVNTPHFARVLLLLKESTISVAIGAYKNIKIKNM